MKTSNIPFYLSLVSVLGLGVVIGRWSAPSGSDDHDQEQETPTEAAEPEVWTCSMHPQVRSPEMGKCPICFMDLIPATTGDDSDLGPRVLQMSESAMALAEILTAPVERRSVAHEIEMVGKVALDETHLSYISSRVPGRLDRLFVDYTGVPVREGDHLVEIYSPTLYATQQELLQAIETSRRLEESSSELIKSSTNRTVRSAREKLRLYGWTDAMLEELLERGTPAEHTTIYAPRGGIVIHKQALEGMYVKEGTPIYTIADLSKVWVRLDAYESDLAWLRFGQHVDFTVNAYPGETFHGNVAFIDPVLDDRTRTIKLRLNVDNADLRLKPDMFVSATLQAKLTQGGQAVDTSLADKWICPMHPEVMADELTTCSECGMDLVPAPELGFVESGEEALSLTIPHTAPLLTGKRSVVYVRVPDAERPTFEGRVVTLGPRAGDRYVVLDGLQEDEEVVVRGNFKIDSELQIRAKPSMMNPEDGELDEEPKILPAPAEFRAAMGAVGDRYVELKDRLSHDQDAPEIAEAIREAIEEMDASGLGTASRAQWDARIPELTAAARVLAQATELETRRIALRPLTEELVRALESFGYHREGGPLRVFHCPMAFENKGANWLQTKTDTENPYYGSAMFPCGSETRVVRGAL